MERDAKALVLLGRSVTSAVLRVTTAPNAAIVRFGTETAAFGAAVLLIGLTIALWLRRFKQQAVRVEGTIVGQVCSAGERAQRSTDPTVTYYSVVKFSTQDGASVRGISRIGSNPPAGKAGDRVTVFYNPRDPERVLVETPRSRARTGWAVAAFAVLGGAPFTAGIGMLLSAVL
jgi:hypothetical protein